MSYGKIYISRLTNAEITNYNISWKNIKYTVPYTKYSIKETDFRVKTASFTSPIYYDLTQGQYLVLINSKYHENFSGVILDVEYDEDKGLYTYQCQDWSRKYMLKYELVAVKDKLYNILMSLITHQGVSFIKPTAKQKKIFKSERSGLKPIGKYNQSYYKGNRYKGNFFNKNISLIMRGKTEIEMIRSLVFNTLGYYDVWFNDKGVLQITPLSKTDWETTGLHLNGEYTNRKFKFSTTNAITTVEIEGTEDKVGKQYKGKDLTGLDLTAFFGRIDASVSTSSENKNSTSAVKKTNSSNKNTTVINNKYGNPFNNKPKKVWINADNGSGGFKQLLAKALKKAGWSVHIGATDSNAHYRDYWNVSKDYSVYITLYNGFCAGTIREAYSSKIQNVLKKKGVQLCPIWHTNDWTNPKGMKPYRYGDFSKYSAKRAWDDNFSRGNPAIKNVQDFFKKHKATYCASPTTAEVMKQFNAGGYFNYKGIKV